MAKRPIDGEVVNLTKKVEVNPLMLVAPDKKWKPNQMGNTTTLTMPFGGQRPKMVDVQSLNKKEN